MSQLQTFNTTDIILALRHLLKQTELGKLDWGYEPERVDYCGDIDPAYITLKTPEIHVSISCRERFTGFLWLNKKHVYFICMYRYENEKYVPDSKVDAWITEGQAKFYCEELFSLVARSYRHAKISSANDTITSVMSA